MTAARTVFTTAPVQALGVALALFLGSGTVALAQDQGRPLPNPLAPKSTGPQPTLAEEPIGQTPPPPVIREPMEEIEVIAPRRTTPDFQSTQEFFQEEFERIRGEFEKPGPPPARDYEVFQAGGEFSSPSVRSTARDQIRSSRRLRDTLSGDPPKAEAKP